MAKRKTGASTLFDPENDPAPDVFTVKWTGEKVRVGHYKSSIDKRECCHVKGQITDVDRTSEHGAEVATLERLQLPCGYR